MHILVALQYSTDVQVAQETREGFILASTRSPRSFMDSSRRAMENHRQGRKARAQGHLHDDAFEAAVDMMAVSFIHSDPPSAQCL